jgi:hypothetical protein
VIRGDFHEAQEAKKSPTSEIDRRYGPSEIAATLVRGHGIDESFRNLEAIPTLSREGIAEGQTITVV